MVCSTLKKAFLSYFIRNKIYHRENKTKTNKFHINQRKLRHLLLAMVMKGTKSSTEYVPAIPPGRHRKRNINKLHCSGYFCFLQCCILVTNVAVVFYIDFDLLTHIQHL